MLASSTTCVSVLVVLLLVSTGCAAKRSPLKLAGSSISSPRVGDELCNPCISFMGEAINELLNIIANGGVIGTCGKLCSQLPKKLEATVCDLLCDAVGIEAFIRLVQDVDPDPIWICEEIKVCPVPSDDPVGSVVSFTVTPLHAPQGHEFTFDVEYNITNDIGTGEFVFEVDPIDDAGPLTAGQVLIQPAPGVYSASFKLATHPDKKESCCLTLCTGGCGSKHDGAKTLAQATLNFTLTAPN